jgi:hypothetical protein
LIRPFGFKFHDLTKKWKKRPSGTYHKKETLVYGDTLYLKDLNSLDIKNQENKQKTLEKLQKLIIICLAYERTDVFEEALNLYQTLSGNTLVDRGKLSETFGVIEIPIFKGRNRLEILLRKLLENFDREYHSYGNPNFP